MHKTMKSIWTWMLVGLLVSVASAGRVVESFNEGWCFVRGEQDANVVQVDFDDTEWEAVRLPHDWAISGPFDANVSGDTGKLPWKDEGWYRKSFELAETESGTCVYLDFDGVMAFPQVYVNGESAGQWDYGYSPFRVDVTPYVIFGAENVVAVHCDTRQWGSRWYPGAGIYRKVTLTQCHPVHVPYHGVQITTPRNPSRRDGVPNVVRVRTTLANTATADEDVTLVIRLLDPDGLQVGRDQRTETVTAAGTLKLDQVFLLSQVQPWDLETPNLYQAKGTLQQGGQVIDEVRETFGLRSFEFTADDGFHLNGRRVQLYGVNLHHDHGPLGAAFYERAMERQLQIMQEMGVNALRTSHNPPAAEVLDLCDRLGILVWDEVFDKWDHTAGRHRGESPLKAFSERQITNVVLRDRNHPCVVVWSIGNEIGEGGEGVTPERTQYMTEFVKQVDPTRPVGLGCHIPGMVEKPNFDALDLTGWNYGHRYDRFRQAYPQMPIIYSESASTLSTRGYYDFPQPTRKEDYPEQSHQVSSYDLNAASWSDIPDKEFKLMTDDAFVAGEFVWTGFDYLGEPTPFTREARSSYFGIVDLVGIPKDRFYLYRSYWRPEVTTVHILPHWTWPEREGQNVPVFVYTNGDEAELFLNGRSLGRRKKGEVPSRVPNLALGRDVTANSSVSEHSVTALVDGDRETYWAADSDANEPWIQLDLGHSQSIGYLVLDFEREEKYYGYEIKVSQDARQWQSIITKPTSRWPRWGGPTRKFHRVEVEGRYLRLEFTELSQRRRGALREWAVYAEPIESDYYDVTYDYRLRWNQVPYEPGELRAVAYRNGRIIGEAVQRTAGPAVALRLTPDRVSLRADGDDLSYVLVEALDSQGTVVPDAEQRITFSVTGPAELAGVGNGNPLSLEAFGDTEHALFHGKAMLILRTQSSQAGLVQVTATAKDLATGRAILRTY